MTKKADDADAVRAEGIDLSRSLFFIQADRRQENPGKSRYQHDPAHIGAVFRRVMPGERLSREDSQRHWPYDHSMEPEQVVFEVYWYSLPETVGGNVVFRGFSWEFIFRKNSSRLLKRFWYSLFILQLPPQPLQLPPHFTPPSFFCGSALSWVAGTPGRRTASMLIISGMTISISWGIDRPPRCWSSVCLALNGSGRKTPVVKCRFSFRELASQLYLCLGAMTPQVRAVISYCLVLLTPTPTSADCQAGSSPYSSIWPAKSELSPVNGLRVLVHRIFLRNDVFSRM